MADTDDTATGESDSPAIPVEKTEIAVQRSSREKIDSGSDKPREIGGPPGPEPTRYGDWEKNGRCIDF